MKENSFGNGEQEERTAWGENILRFGGFPTVPCRQHVAILDLFSLSSQLNAFEEQSQKMESAI